MKLDLTTLSPITMTHFESKYFDFVKTNGKNPEVIVLTKDQYDELLKRYTMDDEILEKSYDKYHITETKERIKKLKERGYYKGMPDFLDSIELEII